MAFSSILAGEIQVGDPITAALMTKIKDNDDFLNGLIGGLDYYDVYNGSFDIDADADGIPDGWTVNLLTGGSTALVSSNTKGHGKNTFQATDPGGNGNGGAELISPFIAVTDLRQYFINWVQDVSSGATGMHIKMELEIYLHDKTSAGSNVVLYDNQTDNPATPRLMIAGWNPGVGQNTRFIRIKFTLGDTDKNQAGTAEISGVSLATSMPQIFSQITSTFTSRTTSNGTYVNLGSPISIDLPHDWFMVGNVPVYVSFPFEFEWNSLPSAGDTAQMRFLVDGVASNVVTFHEGSVGRSQIVQNGIIMARCTPTGETFNLQPQAQVINGSTAISVHKDSTFFQAAVGTPGS